MRILVIGSGGREHALVWKLAQSELAKKIFAAPGNAGIGELAECIPLDTKEIVALADFAVSSKVDLVVVGPESPLVYGIVDYFQERGIPIFGPTKAAARLEGSKAFAKKLMRKAKVPTAEFQIFQGFQEASDFLDRAPVPVVVKADGLAGGKGAVVAQTREEALKALAGIMQERLFGEAGSQVIIEECLQGEELSVLGIVDGSHLALLEPSQDHKRAFEGDQGPNTGGMGAYSPVPRVDVRRMEEIRRRIFEPVIRTMAETGAPFKGVLYAGLMLTSEGPKVLEFNVRFGDPEAQVLLPRLKNDLVEIMLASIEGRLCRVPVAPPPDPGPSGLLPKARPPPAAGAGGGVVWDSRACACVVLASAGYPQKYDLGREITGLKQAADIPDTLVFHAGTKKESGRILSSGGRVLNAVGLGETLEAAVANAYRVAEVLQFEGKQCRRDIGARALKYSERVNE